MIFRRPIFDARVQNHRRWPLGILWKRNLEFLSNVTEGNAKFFLESHLSFENWRRPVHAGAAEQRRIHSVPRCVREGDTFPMRKFTDPRLSHRRTGHAR